MRKKWTYAAIFGMMLGMAPVFTGCIDTDEPAGLEDLRVAKSELLKAKAAVEAARVAEVQAQAALLQAQAKVEEANAVKVQAEAEKIKAEAAIAQAKADYINAKTEQAKAEAQAVIDENNRIQAEWEAEAAVRQAEAEAAIKQAQLATAEALAKYQTVVAALQDTKNKALQPYIAKLNKATKAYYEALDDLRQAQRDYNNQSAVVEENEASKELLTRDLEREVMLKEKALAGADAALARATEELNEAKALQEKGEPSELAAKYDKVNEEIKAMQKEIADLSVQAAEKAVEIFNTQVIPWRALDRELSELRNEAQEIPAFEMDFTDGGYPSYWSQSVVKLPESEYAYSNTTELDIRESELNGLLNTLKSWTRDENDDAWTKDRIANWKGEIAAKKEVLKELKADWLKVVQAYQQGVYGKVDPSKIEHYTEVTDGIAAYNKEAATYNDLSKQIYTLEQQKVADAKTRDGIVTEPTGSAWVTYHAALLDIDEEYDPLIADPQPVLEERRAALEQEVTNAEKAEETAEAAYKEAEKKFHEVENTSTDPNEISAARNAMNAALADWDEKQDYLDAANTALANCTLGSVLNDLINDKATAQGEAVKARTTTIANANKAYDDKWDAEKGTEQAKLDQAYQSRDNAEKAVATAVDNLKESAQLYNDELTVVTPISLYALEGYKYATFATGSSYLTMRTMDASIVKLDKEGLKAEIENRSYQMFGDLFDHSEYGDNAGLLANMEDKDIYAMIESKVDEAIEEMKAEGITQPENTYLPSVNDYVWVCGDYGLYGQVVANEERIRVAESWLTNADLINSKIKQVEDALAELEKGYDTLKETIETKQEKADLALETLQADLEESYLAADQKREELEPMQGLLNAIKHAILDYNATGDKIYGEESVDGIKGFDDYVAECQKLVDNITLDRYDKETLLLNAKDRLAKWNDEAISWLDVLYQKVEDAQIIVDRKKAKMDEVQAALDAVIASLTNDPTSSAVDTPATEE